MINCWCNVLQLHTKLTHFSTQGLNLIIMISFLKAKSKKHQSQKKQFDYFIVSTFNNVCQFLSSISNSENVLVIYDLLGLLAICSLSSRYWTAVFEFWFCVKRQKKRTTSCFQLCLMQMCHHRCTSLQFPTTDKSVRNNTHIAHYLTALAVTEVVSG